MKILLVSSLVAALGLGWAGSRADEEVCAAAAACPIEDCCDLDCEVTPLPDGTCLVECENPDGESCWAVVACGADGECEILEQSGDCCAPSGCCVR